MWKTFPYRENMVLSFIIIPKDKEYDFDSFLCFTWSFKYKQII